MLLDRSGFKKAIWVIIHGLVAPDRQTSHVIPNRPTNLCHSERREAAMRNLLFADSATNECGTVEERRFSAA
jgi:hypothetical protein